MITHWIRILLMLPLLFFTSYETLAQPSSGAKAPLEKADRCADTLLQAKDKKRLSHKWIECVDAYRDVASRFPQSEEAGWALYRGAKLQENLFKYSGKPQDLDGAIELYRRVANEHPNHRIADDAQYRIGTGRILVQAEVAVAGLERDVTEWTPTEHQVVAQVIAAVVLDHRLAGGGGEVQTGRAVIGAGRGGQGSDGDQQTQEWFHGGISWPITTPACADRPGFVQWSRHAAVL